MRHVCGFAPFISRTTLANAGYATHDQAHAAAECGHLYAHDQKATTPCRTSTPARRAKAPSGNRT